MSLTQIRLYQSFFFFAICQYILGQYQYCFPFTEASVAKKTKEGKITSENTINSSTQSPLKKAKTIHVKEEPTIEKKKPFPKKKLAISKPTHLSTRQTRNINSQSSQIDLTKLEGEGKSEEEKAYISLAP